MPSRRSVHPLVARRLGATAGRPASRGSQHHGGLARDPPAVLVSGGAVPLAAVAAVFARPQHLPAVPVGRRQQRLGSWSRCRSRPRFTSSSRSSPSSREVAQHERLAGRAPRRRRRRASARRNAGSSRRSASRSLCSCVASARASRARRSRACSARRSPGSPGSGEPRGAVRGGEAAELRQELGPALRAPASRSSGVVVGEVVGTAPTRRTPAPGTASACPGRAAAAPSSPGSGRGWSAGDSAARGRSWRPGRGSG